LILYSQGRKRGLQVAPKGVKPDFEGGREKIQKKKRREFKQKSGLSEGEGGGGVQGANSLFCSSKGAGRLSEGTWKIILKRSRRRIKSIG